MLDSVGESTHLSGAFASSVPGSLSQTPATRWRSEWYTGTSASWTTTAATTSTSGSWSLSSVMWRRKPSPRNVPDVSLTTVTSTRTSQSRFKSWRGAWESARKEVSAFPSPLHENKRLDIELQQTQELGFSWMIQKCHSLCEKTSGINTLPCKCSYLCYGSDLYPLSWTFVVSTIQKQGKKVSLAQDPAYTVEVLGNCSSDQVPSE